MSTTPGRNDPCPCGSGKKYKHCCLRGEPSPLKLVTNSPAVAKAQAAANSQPQDDSHEHAVSVAMDWLTSPRYSRGFREGFEAHIDAIWPDDAETDTLDDDVDQMLEINVTEWMLARGDILIKGKWTEINELLTGPNGPALTSGQRAWLKQLNTQPLRPYVITEVRSGEGFTVLDALDTDAAPVVVRERSGSESASPGLLLCARLMPWGDHVELSGAVYPVAKLWESAFLDELRELPYPNTHPDDLQFSFEFTLMSAWLRQCLVSPPIPQMTDASTGEPMLLITDHYRITDAKALATALAAEPDVQGDAKQGWSRLIEHDDGQTRSRASINPGKTKARIEVFYRTQRLADEGRAWFNALAGEAVQFLTREITDPAGAISRELSPGAQPAPQSAPPGRAGQMPPELAQAMEQMMRRHYANWADEPIPALSNKTPRQAITKPSGLERVKGLLREYEAGEAEMAAQDGRPPMSYQFLWDALGITR